jgi:hypothetical protein
MTSFTPVLEKHEYRLQNRVRGHGDPNASATTSVSIVKFMLRLAANGAMFKIEHCRGDMPHGIGRLGMKNDKDGGWLEFTRAGQR